MFIKKTLCTIIALCTLALTACAASPQPEIPEPEPTGKSVPDTVLSSNTGLPKEPAHAFHRLTLEEIDFDISGYYGTWMVDRVAQGGQYNSIMFISEDMVSSQGRETRWGIPESVY